MFFRKHTRLIAIGATAVVLGGDAFGVVRTRRILRRR
jgi:hypothetical protein